MWSEEAIFQLRRCMLLTPILAGLALPQACIAQLKVTFGARGVERLTYAGLMLEDRLQFPADAFRIGHMKVTDLSGKVLPNDSWGETNRGTSWDTATSTMTYRFRWGSIQTRFVQRDNALDILVTETNRADSGLIVSGAAIYPLALHFPRLPRGFESAAFPQGGSNTVAPSVLEADYGSAKLVLTNDDASKPLYSMLWPRQGSSPTYEVLASTTPPDGLATFQPHHDRPVLPGQTDSYRISLRFAASGTPTNILAADAYAAWSKRWPMQLNWKDRRVIGTAFLATSPRAGETSPDGPNPRRYMNSGKEEHVDIRTGEGIRLFQARVLQRARDMTRNLRRLNAQGVITWDIEGEQYTQPTSYVCAPDQIAQISPEMESVIDEPGTAYDGKKLDDAYFSILKSAGFRVGVCVRPQKLKRAADGGAQQVDVAPAQAEAELRRKIQYAHDRWGATLFYVDSTVDKAGAPLDAAIFERLAKSFPDSLLIPEQTTAKYHAYTAPFQSFLFHHDLGTRPDVRDYYPRAFSCILVNDAASPDLAKAKPSLIDSVAAGDILMAHADYWDPNNSTILEMYALAAQRKARR